MNKVFLSGRITKDVSYHATETGTEIASFSIAVSAGPEQTYFFNCVCFNSVANFVNSYLKKGSFLTLEGRLTTRKYETKNGGTNTVVEVLADRVESVKETKKPTDNKEEKKVDNTSLFDDRDENDLPF